MFREYSIEWQEFEYEFSEKSSDWFWALGIISISVTLTAIILNNILFAVLIVIGSFTLAIYAARKPDLVHYEVNQRGVMVDHRLYPYGTLDSFWIDYKANKPKLLIDSKKTLMPQIVIPIQQDIDTDLLRDYLLDHIDEEEKRESLSTQIMEWLGF